MSKLNINISVKSDLSQICFLLPYLVKGKENVMALVTKRLLEITDIVHFFESDAFLRRTTQDYFLYLLTSVDEIYFRKSKPVIMHKSRLPSYIYSTIYLNRVEVTEGMPATIMRDLKDIELLAVIRDSITNKGVLQKSKVNPFTGTVIEDMEQEEVKFSVPEHLNDVLYIMVGGLAYQGFSSESYVRSHENSATEILRNINLLPVERYNDALRVLLYLPTLEDYTELSYSVINTMLGNPDTNSDTLELISNSLGKLKLPTYSM